MHKQWDKRTNLIQESWIKLALLNSIPVYVLFSQRAKTLYVLKHLKEPENVIVNQYKIGKEIYVAEKLSIWFHRGCDSGTFRSHL